MFEKLGFKNITSSKTIGFLTLLLILLESLFWCPINLPHLNIIRYIVLGIFLILLIYFLEDHRIDEKIIKNSKGLGSIITHLKSENKRLHKMQLSDLSEFEKYKNEKNETMAEKYNTNTGTQTK